jgi:hypothetical protein
MSWIFTVIAIIVIAISALRYIFNKHQGSFGKAICLLLIAISLIYLAWLYLVPLLIAFFNWFRQNLIIFIVLLVAICAIVAWLIFRKRPEPLLSLSPQAISGKEGYIYISHSAALKEDIFKVGMTRGKPEDRMEQLGQGTGVPSRFLIVKSWHVCDCIKAESVIHDALKQYRFNPNREFFQAPYEKIFGIADQIIRDINTTG